MNVEMGLGKTVLSKGKRGFPYRGNARPRLSQWARLSMDKVTMGQPEPAPLNLPQPTSKHHPKSQHVLEKNPGGLRESPGLTSGLKVNSGCSEHRRAERLPSFRQRSLLCTPPKLPTQHKSSFVMSANVHSFPKPTN